MPDVGSKTKHHCPMASHGNCRKAFTASGWYCGTHQDLCATHDEMSKLIGEDCSQCIGEALTKARKEQKAHTAKREKEVAEFLEKQSEDKAAKAKQARKKLDSQLN
ncbi:hypothetical protein M426DRAFT_11907 [Hypoxylon sp. CI-4A]|nr:hypothetical protein M426DRAFT_11907 [Hypoxylon sp. CI-4A]